MAGERRVAVAFHEDVPGGATLSVLRVVPLLQERGWSFRFWASSPSPLYDELRARGLEVEGAERGLAYSTRALRLPPGISARFRGLRPYLREFRRFLERSDAELLHANSLFTLAEATVASRAGLATVFHVHEMLPPTRKGRLAALWAQRVSDEIVAVSLASARAFGGDPTVVYEATPFPSEPLLREPGERTVAGTVGVISTRKGSDLFVEAARLVGERRPEIGFTIIGAPTDALERDWAARVLADAARLGIEHHERADVAEMLGRWDIFVLPSRRDPYPISMLEAMAAGLPVIGADVDGLSEQIDESSGVLVPPESPERLAEAIIALHDDRDRRRALGRAARERAQREFSIERQAAGLDAAYEAALSRRAARR